MPKVPCTNITSICSLISLIHFCRPIKSPEKNQSRSLLKKRDSNDVCLTDAATIISTRTTIHIVCTTLITKGEHLKPIFFTFWSFQRSNVKRGSFIPRGDCVHTSVACLLINTPIFDFCRSLFQILVHFKKSTKVSSSFLRRLLLSYTWFLINVPPITEVIALVFTSF